MSITGVYQFPQNPSICGVCGFMCWTEQKNGKVVVSHPTHPTCPNSHRAFEVYMAECSFPPQEFLK